MAMRHRRQGMRRHSSACAPFPICCATIRAYFDVIALGRAFSSLPFVALARGKVNRLDARTFDDFARFLASDTSRRRVLGLLAGATTLLVGGRRRAWAQCANPQTCTDDAECCPGFQCDSDIATCVGMPPCAPDGEPCSDDAGCCSGNCLGGTCLACRDAGIPCSQTSQCCENRTCFDGVCRDCKFLGSSCADQSQCCEGDCLAGQCLACRPDGMDCVDDGDCCGVCWEGVCQSCFGEVEECTRSSECCSGACLETEMGTVCVACLPVGTPCESGNTCCFGICTDGVCPERVCAGDEDCLPGLMCIDSVCSAPCAEDTACPTGAICCGGACRRGNCCVGDSDPNPRCATGDICAEGFCEAGPCAAAGGACARDSDCCPNLICPSGTCQRPKDSDDSGDDPVQPPDNSEDRVTVLPSTGMRTRTGLANERSLFGGAWTAATLFWAARKVRQASEMGQRAPHEPEN